MAALIWVAVKDHHKNNMEEVMDLLPATGRPGKAFLPGLSHSLVAR